MKTCYASDCDHNFKRGGCKSYFRFPIVDKEINKQWLIAVRHTVASESSRICSCHFLDNLKQNGPKLYKYNNFGNMKIDMSATWPSKFLRCLGKMQKNGFLCDVTIETSDNQAVKFHSVVLVAASPVMQDIVENELGADTQMEGVTIRSGYAGAVWRALAAFLYTGERKFTATLYCDFVELVEELQIKPLRKKIHGKRDRIPITAPRVNGWSRKREAAKQIALKKRQQAAAAKMAKSQEKSTPTEENAENPTATEETSENPENAEENPEKSAAVEEGLEMPTKMDESSETPTAPEVAEPESEEEAAAIEETPEEVEPEEKRDPRSTYTASTSESDYSDDDERRPLSRRRKGKKPGRKRKNVKSVKSWAFANDLSDDDDEDYVAKVSKSSRRRKNKKSTGSEDEVAEPVEPAKKRNRRSVRFKSASSDAGDAALGLDTINALVDPAEDQNDEDEATDADEHMAKLTQASMDLHGNVHYPGSDPDGVNLQLVKKEVKRERVDEAFDHSSADPDTDNDNAEAATPGGGNQDDGGGSEDNVDVKAQISNKAENTEHDTLINTALETLTDFARMTSDDNASTAKKVTKESRENASDTESGDEKLKEEKSTDNGLKTGQSRVKRSYRKTGAHTKEPKTKGLSPKVRRGIMDVVKKTKPVAHESSDSETDSAPEEVKPAKHAKVQVSKSSLAERQKARGGGGGSSATKVKSVRFEQPPPEEESEEESDDDEPFFNFNARNASIKKKLNLMRSKMEAELSAFNAVVSDSNKLQVPADADTVDENYKWGGMIRAAEMNAHESRLCEMCGLTVTSRRALTRHIYNTHRHQQVVCSACGVAFLRYRSLRQHEKNINSHDSRLCDICGASVKSKQALTKHIYCVHKKQQAVCSVCGVKFSRANNLRRHEQRVHDMHGGRKKPRQRKYGARPQRQGQSQGQSQGQAEAGPSYSHSGQGQYSQNNSQCTMSQAGSDTLLSLEGHSNPGQGQFAAAQNQAKVTKDQGQRSQGKSMGNHEAAKGQGKKERSSSNNQPQPGVSMNQGQMRPNQGQMRTGDAQARSEFMDKPPFSSFLYPPPDLQNYRLESIDNLEAAAVGFDMRMGNRAQRAFDPMRFTGQTPPFVFNPEAAAQVEDMRFPGCRYTNDQFYF